MSFFLAHNSPIQVAFSLEKRTYENPIPPSSVHEKHTQGRVHLNWKKIRREKSMRSMPLPCNHPPVWWPNCILYVNIPLGSDVHNCSLLSSSHRVVPYQFGTSISMTRGITRAEPGAMPRVLQNPTWGGAGSGRDPMVWLLPLFLLIWRFSLNLQRRRNRARAAETGGGVTGGSNNQWSNHPSVLLF